MVWAVRLLEGFKLLGGPQLSSSFGVIQIYPHKHEAADVFQHNSGAIYLVEKGRGNSKTHACVINYFFSY